MTILILGTGALACLFAARLTEVANVVMAGTWPEALEAIRRHGVRIEGEAAVPVKAVHRDGLLPVANVALVLVKAHQTGAVAPIAARVTRENGLILTLQNGLGNLEALRAAGPAAAVAAGITTIGATLVAPGVIRSTGRGEIVLGGDAVGEPNLVQPLLDRLWGRLLLAGFQARLVEDIQPDLWRKLAVNCAINGTSALARMPNGQLLGNRVAAEVLDLVASEVAGVAQAAGITGVNPIQCMAYAHQVARATAQNRSSMLQDLDNHRPTEVESLHGEVVRRARVLGVPVPATAWLLGQILAVEAGQEPQPLEGALEASAVGGSAWLRAAGGD